jgi:hypothetical protein
MLMKILFAVHLKYSRFWPLPTVKTHVKLYIVHAMLLHCMSVALSVYVYNDFHGVYISTKSTTFAIKAACSFSRESSCYTDCRLVQLVITKTVRSARLVSLFINTNV